MLRLPSRQLSGVAIVRPTQLPAEWRAVFKAAGVNKADLADQRVVSWEVASQYANSIGALIYDTSAKANTGVSQLFTDVARRLVSQKSRSSEASPAGGLVPLPDPLAPDSARRSKCC